MKQVWVLSLLAALPLISAAQTKPGADAETFFRQIDTVLAQKDSAAFEKMLTPDFAFIAITGDILSRAQILERHKAGILTAGSANEIISTRVFGDTAIITYRTKTANNVTIVGTRVLVKQAGAWKWALSQGTRVGGTLPTK